MKLTELIALAQLKLSQHGDLDVLSEEFYPISSLHHEVSEGGFESSWNMPEGYEYIQLCELK